MHCTIFIEASHEYAQADCNLRNKASTQIEFSVCRSLKGCSNFFLLTLCFKLNYKTFYSLRKLQKAGEIHLCSKLRLDVTLNFPTCSLKSSTHNWPALFLQNNLFLESRIETKLAMQKGLVKS